MGIKKEVQEVLRSVNSKRKRIKKRRKMPRLCLPPCSRTPRIWRTRKASKWKRARKLICISTPDREPKPCPSRPSSPASFSWTPWKTRSTDGDGNAPIMETDVFIGICSLKVTFSPPRRRESNRRRKEKSKDLRMRRLWKKELKKREQHSQVRVWPLWLKRRSQPGRRGEQRKNNKI